MVKKPSCKEPQLSVRELELWARYGFHGSICSIRDGGDDCSNERSNHLSEEDSPRRSSGHVCRLQTPHMSGSLRSSGLNNTSEQKVCRCELRAWRGNHKSNEKLCQPGCIEAVRACPRKPCPLSRECDRTYCETRAIISFSKRTHRYESSKRHKRDNQGDCASVNGPIQDQEHDPEV